MRTKKRLLILLGILLLIQLIRIDKTNPPIDPAVDFEPVVKPPDDVMVLLKSACYDCHSNETRYPWYSNVAPVSWWLKHHINEAREHLKTAKEMINRMGYHRRDKEVEELEEQLKT